MAATVVGGWLLTGSLSSPSAIVTRTYDAVWPVDHIGPVSGQPPPVPLATVIRWRVSPDSWDHDGCVVRAVGAGRAIVTAPIQTQAAVARLIHDQAYQVSIETRILTVSAAELAAAGVGPLEPGLARPIDQDGVYGLMQFADVNAADQALTMPRLTLSNGQRCDFSLESSQARIYADGSGRWYRMRPRAVVSADHLTVDLTGGLTFGVRTRAGVAGEWSAAANVAARVPTGGGVVIRAVPTGGDGPAGQTVAIWVVTILEPHPPPLVPRRRGWWGLPDGWVR